MSKNTIIAGIGGLVIGMLFTAIVASQAVRNNNTAVLRVMGVQTTKTADHSSMSMNDMTKQLEGKTGDEFDKAFIAMMIVHHQGAIDMAKMVEANAKHAELKKLGTDILSAQSKEIDMMQTWQTDWGYVSTPQSHDMHNM